MTYRINIKLKLITTLLIFIIFSCQEKENIISSYSLNKADGIYKFKEIPFTGTVLDTTNSGRVILTFNCIKGKLNGKYLEYYVENGNLKQKSTYENGNKTGPYLRLSKDGDTISYGNFLNYKKNGVWKEFYDNGNLKSIGQYENDLQNGEWKEFYGNGNLKSIGQYENDLQNGEWKFYFYNGKIKALGKYKNGDESKFGATNIPISGRYGEWLFYSEETGEIAQKCDFENGMRSGQLIAFYPNGQIEAKGTFKNDEFDGVFETFDESGKLKSKDVWENGKKLSSE